MGLLCGCPRAAALPAITIDLCLENVGQIQKMVFQRLRKADGTKNKFVVATADPAILASWTPLLVAADDTKVVQTPYLTAPEFEPGAARKYGGGNATLGGAEIIIGREPTAVKGNFLRLQQATIKQLKKYQCEEVGVYFIDEFGRIIGDSDGLTVPLEYYPIPVQSLFIGDKKPGGLEGIDMNDISFSLFPNWSDNVRIITPTNFAALTDLKTP